MMISNQIRMMINPPEWWPDFQELTLDVCNVRWPSAVNEIYGREGQEQRGIDITSVDGRGRKGVECKKRRQPKSRLDRVPTGGPLNAKSIDKIINKADAEGLSLTRLCIATTLRGDTFPTEFLTPVNERRAADGQYMVEIWPWESIQRDICDHAALLYRYYEKVMASDSNYSAELHLLSLLRGAFMRPAFDTPLSSEDSTKGFQDALAVTQYAVVDGKLRDRVNNELIVCSAPYGVGQMKSNHAFFAPLSEIRDVLQGIRDDFTNGMKSGVIHDTPHGPRPSGEIGWKIDTERARCVKMLNDLLKDVNLDPVPSRLLRYLGNGNT